MGMVTHRPQKNGLKMVDPDPMWNINYDGAGNTRNLFSDERGTPEAATFGVPFPAIARPC